MTELLPVPDSTWSTGALILAFLAATAVIGVGGTRMAGFADRLADRTGMGEAMMGALFLGVFTSLPGITASVTAAVDGHPTLAVSNAMGGIAVQTAFLAIADLFHRRANLEHAAASLANLTHAALLILLLSVVLTALAAPIQLTLGHVDAATPALVAAYLLGLWTAKRALSRPMWHPRVTADTVEDRPRQGSEEESLPALWLGFAAAAVLVMISGALVARSAGLLTTRTGLSETVVGGSLLATATSLPELVTTVAAVRRGALTLAVSDIAGGNAFDVLFVCVADAFYVKGSIFQAAGGATQFLVGLAILLNSILLLGLLHREKHGPVNIGLESLLILILYLVGFTIVVLGS